MAHLQDLSMLELGAKFFGSMEVQEKIFCRTLGPLILQAIAGQCLGLTWAHQNVKLVAIQTQTPSARAQHVATWDDVELSIWLHGGYDDQGLCDDLWRFDVTTRSWNLIPASGPSARAYHVAVWDPANLAMWIHGGFDGQACDDLWQFDALSSHWVLIHRGGPLARFNHIAAWDMITMTFWVHGGYVDNGPLRSDLWRFDVTSTTTSMSTSSSITSRSSTSTVTSSWTVSSSQTSSTTMTSSTATSTDSTTTTYTLSSTTSSSSVSSTESTSATQSTSSTESSTTSSSSTQTTSSISLTTSTTTSSTSTKTTSSSSSSSTGTSSSTHSTTSTKSSTSSSSATKSTSSTSETISTTTSSTSSLTFTSTSSISTSATSSSSSHTASSSSTSSTSSFTSSTSMTSSSSSSSDTSTSTSSSISHTHTTSSSTTSTTVTSSTHTISSSTSVSTSSTSSRSQSTSSSTTTSQSFTTTSVTRTTTSTLSTTGTTTSITTSSTSVTTATTSISTRTRSTVTTSTSSTATTSSTSTYTHTLSTAKDWTAFVAMILCPIAGVMVLVLIVLIAWIWKRFRFQSILIIPTPEPPPPPPPPFPKPTPPIIQLWWSEWNALQSPPPQIARIAPKPPKPPKPLLCLELPDLTKLTCANAHPGRMQRSEVPSFSPCPHICIPVFPVQATTSRKTPILRHHPRRELSKTMVAPTLKTSSTVTGSPTERSSVETSRHSVSFRASIAQQLIHRAHRVCSDIRITLNLPQLHKRGHRLALNAFVQASPELNVRGRPSTEGPQLQRDSGFQEQARLNCTCFLQRRQALPTKTLATFWFQTQATIYRASATAEKQLPMSEFHPEPPVNNAYTVPQGSIPVLGLVRGRSRQQGICSQRSFLQIDVVSMTRIHLESASITSTIFMAGTPPTLPSRKRPASAESESNSQKPKIPNAVQTPPILQTPADRPGRYRNGTPRKKHGEITTKSSRTPVNIRERAFYMPSLRMSQDARS